MNTRIDQITRIAAIALLALGCFYVLQPFIAAALFAGVFCLATWPLFAWLRRVVRGSNTWAAALLTVGTILLILVPFAIIAGSATENVPFVVDAVRGWLDEGWRKPPEWLTTLPAVGGWFDDYWHRLAASREELAALGKRMLDPARKTLLAGARMIGEGILQISLATFISFFFYRDGDALIGAIRADLHRVAGIHADEIFALVANTTRGVIYGIVGTALAQGALALIGFLIAGVPAPFVLGGLVALLSIIPAGPVLVWGGATIWLFTQGTVGWAIFMGVWGLVVVSGIDNILKPLLISRGSTMPFVLVLLGVLGGMIAFGFIGIFLGPVLLAVGFNIARKWLTP